MNEYLHPCVDGTIASELDANKDLKRFAQELYHAYGLRVVGKAKIHPYRNDNSVENTSYVVADVGELAVGRFFVEKISNTEFQYCFNTPYYEKERGSDTLDRHTVRSKKLSTLMRVMKKNNVVVNSDHVYQGRLAPILNRMGRYVADAKGSEPHKGNNISNEDWHKLLLAIKEGKTFEEINLACNKSFEYLLDKWNDVDKTKAIRDEELLRFFANGVLLGMDSMNQFVLVELVKSEKPMTIERKCIKRLTSLDEYPDVQAIFTMFKTYCEETLTHEGFKRNGIPDRNDYYSAVDVVTVAEGLHDPLGCLWLSMPRCQV